MVKILKNAELSNKRKFKGDIDQLTSKVKELEYDNRELVTKLREKEKVAEFLGDNWLIFCKGSEYIELEI